MDKILYQHHQTISKWMADFEEKCDENFVWLEEVMQVALENFQKRDVEVLPKTPSVARKKARRKKPVILSSEDDDFEDPPPPRSSRTSQSDNTDGADQTDDQKSATSARSKGSTRSTRSAKSASSTRSTRSTKSARAKKKVNYMDDDTPSMQSICEVDEEMLSKSPEPVDKGPAAKLFQISEESRKVDTPPVTGSVNEMDETDGLANTPKSPLVVKKTPVASLKSPLQRLKKTLTPVSPKVALVQIKMSGSESEDKSTSDADHDDEMAAATVKQKVRAYDNLIHKLSPVVNRSILNISATDVPDKYTSVLNVTLSSERLPAKSRVIRQISNSPQTKRLSTNKRKSSIANRRSSAVSRKSERIQQQASRMSLSKRKSFLMKNRTSLVAAEPEVEAPMVDSPRVSTPKTVTKVATSTPAGSSRKRQLVTDSDSSQNGTPRMAKKRVRSEKSYAESPRVRKLKDSDRSDKSSDSEYVTDDSDVPMTPRAGQKKNKYRTPPRVPMRTTPQSPGLSGSFIKRNTPKALTLKERQEMYKKEFSQKRQVEERRLEKIRIQKQQELERQKRKREERHQQVQAKRLAQEKAATQQSITSVKSKEKRGSAIIREQREKAEIERQKRIKKQAEVEERRRKEEEKRLQKLKEKEEEAKLVQAMMQRKKEYEEQERLRRIQEEKRLAEEKRLEAETRRREQEAEARRREQEAELKRQREEAERAKTAQNTSLNTSQLNKSLADTYKNEQQTYDIDDIRSDDETDDEDAPKKSIPPWATGHRMKASMIHQHYKPPNIDEIFPPCVLLLAPDLNVIFPHKVRPRFQKRTSSAVWSPIQKHFIKNMA